MATTVEAMKVAAPAPSRWTDASAVMPVGLLRPLVKVHKARQCDTCSETYWRRNLTEVWAVRNDGHRRGWMKVVARQCMACQNVETSRRVLVAAAIAWTAPVVAGRVKVRAPSASVRVKRAEARRTRS